MHHLNQKSVVWNYLRLLIQRAAIYSVQRVAVTSPLSPVLFSSAQPRVNVYLCIKQALFIRPMNMHCLVAVARCRVQTRRYHCLINHIQSHRLTLCRPPLFLDFPLFTVLYPRVPRSRSPLSPLSRRGEDPPRHPSELSARFPSSCYPIRSLFHLAIHSPVVASLANWPQLTLIYVIFSGHPHVTALQCTLNVLDAGAEYARMWFANVMGAEKREEGDAWGPKRGRRVESPNGHPWSLCGDIRNVNRTNQSGTNRPRNWSDTCGAFRVSWGTRVSRESVSLFLKDPRRVCHSIAILRKEENTKWLETRVTVPITVPVPISVLLYFDKS